MEDDLETRSPARTLKRILIVVGLVAGLFYFAESVSIRFKIPGSRETMSAVQVDYFYATHRKDGRTEYSYGESQSEACVRSVFPHQGFTPCWYLRMKPKRQVDLSE